MFARAARQTWQRLHLVSCVACRPLKTQPPRPYAEVQCSWTILRLNILYTEAASLAALAPNRNSEPRIDRLGIREQLPCRLRARNLDAGTRRKPATAITSKQCMASFVRHATITSSSTIRIARPPAANTNPAGKPTPRRAELAFLVHPQPDA